MKTLWNSVILIGVISSLLHHLWRPLVVCFSFSNLIHLLSYVLAQRTSINRKIQSHTSCVVDLSNGFFFVFFFFFFIYYYYIRPSMRVSKTKREEMKQNKTNKETRTQTFQSKKEVANQLIFFTYQSVALLLLCSLKCGSFWCEKIPNESIKRTKQILPFRVIDRRIQIKRSKQSDPPTDIIIKNKEAMEAGARGDAKQAGVIA